MWRKLAFSGCCVAALVALAGCGRSFMAWEQREPWRREAEIACLKSGKVRQTVAVTPAKAIEGPGICGADYPLRVAALGDAGATALGYAGEMRPPGAIPANFPIQPPRPTAPPAGYGQPAAQPPAAGDPGVAPLSIHPPGTEPEEDDTADLDGDPYAAQPNGPAPPYGGRSAAPAYPQGNPLPRLGPERAPAMSYAAAIQPAATLACPMVSALDDWMAASVQPAARRWFGQPIVEIKQISAYSCRGMNGQRNARISEHAFGNALDIAAFTLADGRRITVKGGWRGAPEEQGFLRDVHASACEQFSTVLAPGSNVFHYDHIHVDLARRRSGRVVCNPAAVPGEVIARRVRERYAAGGGRLGYAAERPHPAEDFPIDLPRAVPGAD